MLAHLAQKACRERGRNVDLAFADLADDAHQLAPKRPSECSPQPGIDALGQHLLRLADGEK